MKLGTRNTIRRLLAAGGRARALGLLLRAKSHSSRAKRCRGRSRWQLYRAKRDALDQLVELLAGDGDALGLAWGWRSDPSSIAAPFVLYVELPLGTFAFHSPRRGPGPEFPAPEFPAAGNDHSRGAWPALRAASIEALGLESHS